jgi:hypothetical protein
MLNFIKKYKTYIIGIVIGAIAGFLYWRFVGCSSGSCPITSKWYNTMLYGAIMGALLGSPVRKKEKVKPEEGKNIL